MHTLLLLLLRLLLLHNYLLLLLRLIPKNFDVALLTATLILLRYFIRYVKPFPRVLRHPQHHGLCGTRKTYSTPLHAALAALPLPCMRYSQHYPSLVCGTRNTTPPVYAVLATLLPLVCGTRNTVLGGTRHTTYSCDVQRYSRHFLLLCGTRNSTLLMCC